MNENGPVKAKAKDGKDFNMMLRVNGIIQRINKT